MLHQGLLAPDSSSSDSHSPPLCSSLVIQRNSQQDASKTRSNEVQLDTKKWNEKNQKACLFSIQYQDNDMKSKPLDHMYGYETIGEEEDINPLWGALVYWY